MPGEIVASNALLRKRSETFRTYLNSGMSLRLFANQFTPTPADKLASFVESGFPGYLRVNLDNQFQAPAKVKDGLYETKTLTQSFTCTGATNQVAWGWFITDGVDVLLSRPFIVGVEMAPGKSVELIIKVQTWAASMLREK